MNSENILRNKNSDGMRCQDHPSLKQVQSKQIDGHGTCSSSSYLEEDKENWRDRAEVVTKPTHNAYNEYAKELLADVVNSVPIMAEKQDVLLEKRLASVKVKQIADSDSEYESANEMDDALSVLQKTPSMRKNRNQDMFENSFLSCFEKLKLNESGGEFLETIGSSEEPVALTQGAAACDGTLHLATGTSSGHDNPEKKTAFPEQVQTAFLDIGNAIVDQNCSGILKIEGKPVKFETKLLENNKFDIELGDLMANERMKQFKDQTLSELPSDMQTHFCSEKHRNEILVEHGHDESLSAKLEVQMQEELLTMDKDPIKLISEVIQREDDLIDNQGECEIEYQNISVLQQEKELQLLHQGMTEEQKYHEREDNLKEVNEVNMRELEVQKDFVNEELNGIDNQNLMKEIVDLCQGVSHLSFDASPSTSDHPSNLNTKPVASDHSTSPRAKPVASDHPSSPSVKPVVTDHLCSPSVEHVVTGHPSSHTVEPVVTDHPSCPSVKPVVSDHPSSPSVEPAVTDHPSSPSVEPAVTDHPNSPSAKLVTTDHPSCTVFKTVVIDHLSHPVSLSVATDHLSSPRAQPAASCNPSSPMTSPLASDHHSSSIVKNGANGHLSSSETKSVATNHLNNPAAKPVATDETLVDSFKTCVMANISSPSAPFVASSAANTSCTTEACKTPTLSCKRKQQLQGTVTNFDALLITDLATNWPACFSDVANLVLTNHISSPSVNPIISDHISSPSANPVASGHSHPSATPDHPSSSCTKLVVTDHPNTSCAKPVVADHPSSPRPNLVASDHPNSPSTKPVTNECFSCPSVKLDDTDHFSSPSAKPVASDQPSSPRAKLVANDCSISSSPKPVASDHPTSPSAKHVANDCSSSPSPKPIASDHPTSPSTKFVDNDCSSSPSSKPVHLLFASDHSSSPGAKPVATDEALVDPFKSCNVHNSSPSAKPAASEHPGMSTVSPVSADHHSSPSVELAATVLFSSSSAKPVVVAAHHPSSPINQPVAADHLSSPCAKPDAADHPSSPCAQPVANDHLGRPSAKPVAISPDHPNSPFTKPVVADRPSSPCAKPVAADHPSSPIAKPVVADLSSSSRAKPVANDYLTSPSAKPIANKPSCRPGAKPYAADHLSSPRAKAVAADHLSSPSVNPAASDHSSGLCIKPVNKDNSNSPGAKPVAIDKTFVDPFKSRCKVYNSPASTMHVAPDHPSNSTVIPVAYDDPSSPSAKPVATDLFSSSSAKPVVVTTDHPSNPIDKPVATVRRSCSSAKPVASEHLSSPRANLVATDHSSSPSSKHIASSHISSSSAKPVAVSPEQPSNPSAQPVASEHPNSPRANLVATDHSSSSCAEHVASSHISSPSVKPVAGADICSPSLKVVSDHISSPGAKPVVTDPLSSPDAKPVASDGTLVDPFTSRCKVYNSPPSAKPFTSDHSSNLVVYDDPSSPSAKSVAIDLFSSPSAEPDVAPDHLRSSSVKPVAVSPGYPCIPSAKPVASEHLNSSSGSPDHSSSTSAKHITSDHIGNTRAKPVASDHISSPSAKVISDHISSPGAKPVASDETLVDPFMSRCKVYNSPPSGKPVVSDHPSSSTVNPVATDLVGCLNAEPAVSDRPTSPASNAISPYNSANLDSNLVVSNHPNISCTALDHPSSPSILCADSALAICETLVPREINSNPNTSHSIPVANESCCPVIVSEVCSDALDIGDLESEVGEDTTVMREGNTAMKTSNDGSVLQSLRFGEAVSLEESVGVDIEEIDASVLSELTPTLPTKQASNTSALISNRNDIDMMKIKSSACNSLCEDSSSVCLLDDDNTLVDQVTVLKKMSGSVQSITDVSDEESSLNPENRDQELNESMSDTEKFMSTTIIAKPDLKFENECINDLDETLVDPFKSCLKVYNSPPSAPVAPTAANTSCTSEVFKTPTLPGKRRQQLQRTATNFDASPITNLATNSPASLSNLANSTNIEELTSTREDFGSELTAILQRNAAPIAGGKKVRQSMTSLEFDEITNSALALVNKVTPDRAADRRLTLSVGPQLAPGQDTFTDASQFFNNPCELDELASHGAAPIDRFHLVRNSLYVKFDPLVAGRPSLAPLLTECRAGSEAESGERRRDTRLMSFSPSPQKDIVTSLLDTSLLDSTITNATVVSHPTPVNPGECPHCSRDNTWVPESELKNLELALQASHLRSVREWEQRCTCLSRQAEEQGVVCQDLQEHNTELTNTLQQLQVVVAKIVQQKVMLEQEHREELQQQQQALMDKLERGASEAAVLQQEYNKLEATYFDHIQKYQRLRDVATTLHTNEVKLTERVQDLQTRLNTKTDQVKELFKTVDEKLKKAEMMAEEERQRLQQEKNMMTVLLKRETLRTAGLQDSVTSLQTALDKERAQNKELQTLLDHLTAGAGM